MIEGRLGKAARVLLNKIERKKLKFNGTCIHSFLCRVIALQAASRQQSIGEEESKFVPYDTSRVERTSLL